MKNTIKLFGIIAFAVVFAFSFAACNNNGDDGGGGTADPALNAHWVNSAAGMDLVLNNGNFTFGLNLGGGSFEALKGTYTTSGNTLTMKFNQVNGVLLVLYELDELGISASQWYDEPEFKAAIIDFFKSYGATQAEAEAMYNEDEDLAQAVKELFGSHKGTYSLNAAGTTLTLTMEESDLFEDEPIVLSKQ